MFHDETSSVAAKSRKQIKKSASPGQIGTATDISDSGADKQADLVKPTAIGELSVDDLTLGYQLSPSIDDRALGFFFKHNVTRQSGGFSVVDTEQHLQASVKALGLAGYANSVHSPELLGEARRHYLAAIRLTNAALCSSTLAKRDSTLLSTMILTSFETLVGNDQRSLESWAHHVNGSAALHMLRGPARLKSIDGRRLFRQSSVLLLVNCLARALPVPPHIRELKEAAAKYENNPEDLGWCLITILMELVDFHCDIKQSKIRDPEVILARAMELDRLLDYSFAIPTWKWAYSVVYTAAESPLLFSDHYHVYRSYVASSAWNAMRNCRIILQRIMLDVLTRAGDLFPGSEESIAECMSILHQMRMEIFASVPQHLGFDPERAFRRSSAASSQSQALQATQDTFLWSAFDENGVTLAENAVSSSLPVLRTSGGYTLPWSLYSAAECIETGSVRARRYAKDMLEYIGRMHGARQALVLAGFL